MVDRKERYSLRHEQSSASNRLCYACLALLHHFTLVVSPDQNKFIQAADSWVSTLIMIKNVLKWSAWREVTNHLWLGAVARVDAVWKFNLFLVSSSWLLFSIQARFYLFCVLTNQTELDRLIYFRKTRKILVLVQSSGWLDMWVQSTFTPVGGGNAPLSCSPASINQK